MGFIKTLYVVVRAPTSFPAAFFRASWCLCARGKSRRLASFLGFHECLTVPSSSAGSEVTRASCTQREGVTRLQRQHRQRRRGVATNLFARVKTDSAPMELDQWSGSAHRRHGLRESRARKNHCPIQREMPRRGIDFHSLPFLSPSSYYLRKFNQPNLLPLNE